MNFLNKTEKKKKEWKKIKIELTQERKNHPPRRIIFSRSCARLQLGGQDDDRSDREER